MLKTIRSGLMGATALASTLFVVTGGEAQAQEVALQPISIISIFATASGAAETFEFPGSVSVVDKKAIDDLIATRPADIFSGVPGVTFEGGPRQSGQVPTIRGLEGEGVVILFDDARQNFVSGHDGRFFLDPDLLKAAEVVRGPASSIYGSGAVGGVLAFRTIEAGDILEPGQDAAIRAKVGGQSVDVEQNYAVTAVARSSDKAVDVVGHVGYRTSGNIDLGNNTILPADDQVNNALAKLTLRLADGWKWTTSWLFHQLEGVDPQNPQGAAVPANDNPEVNRLSRSRTLQSKVEFNPASSKAVDASLVVYQTENRVEEPETVSGRLTTRDVDTLGFKLDNTSRFNVGSATAVKFTYGTDIYRDEQIGDDSASANGARGGVPNATSNFFGLFAEAEIDIGKPGRGLGQLSLIPGIRYDTFKTTSALDAPVDATAFSPKIAAAYKPVEWFNLFGNYGKAFRAPSFNEAYSIGTHFAIPLPGGVVANEFITNPNLAPEEAIGWEAGAGFKFDNVLFTDDKFQIKGSYWRNNVENLIDLEVKNDLGNISLGCFGVPFQPPCVGGAAAGLTSQNVNVANAELEGIDIEATYDSKYLFLRSTYTQIEGRDTVTGLFAGALFPTKFYVDAAVKFANLGARIGARLEWAGTFDQGNSIDDRRESYQVVDLYAVWEPKAPKLKGLRFDIGIDNVADEDYEIVAAQVSEEGRSYKGSVRYTLPICGSGDC